MAELDLVLHQFPISHYCEKIRWVLDHKLLHYRVKNQFPGMHVLVNKRLVGRGTVPLLIDRHHAVGNSSQIALYLDDQFPEGPLIPREPELRARVLELEAYFDEQVGPPVRTFAYSYVLRDASVFRELFFRHYPRNARWVAKLVASPLSWQIGKMYGVGQKGVDSALHAIEQAATRLEQLTGGDPSRYLVGAALSLADVTAASLLGPLVAPEGSPWDPAPLLPELLAQRDSMRARPAGRWLLARYAERAPSMQRASG